MLIKTSSPDRRRFLQGVMGGAKVAVALPFLNMFLNDSGTALAATRAALPERFGTWFWGLGVDPSQFTPKTVGALGDLPPELKPLDKYKQQINVLSGYNVVTDGRPNLCHYTGWVALRTGSAPGGRGDLPNRSLDIPIIDLIGGSTRFASLNMASTGEPRDSYSFLSADAVNPPEISAVEMYQKLFGAEFQDPNSPAFTPNPALMARRSVLSSLGDGRKDFERTLGTADKERIDQYFTSIREFEQRLELQLQKPPPAPNCKVPTAPKEIPVGVDIDQVKLRHRAMTDLLAMALACNQTKVFNMIYSGSASHLSRKGLDKTHHVLTHEEASDPATGIQPQAATFVVEALNEFGYFIDRLATTPEGDGSLLDRSLIFAHSDCEIAKVHSIDRIPMITAGRLNGKVKTGQHIDGKGEPGTRVGLTLQKLMGVPVTGWGTGSLQVTQEIGELVA
jgi:hypothetical protein